jgi:LmbE family N-acetylglucosaminyl deacetylase
MPEGAARPIALALLAHPDDAEILCGGTLVLLARRGWELHVATATPGDCGSAERQPDDIARIRRGEGEAAAARIGARFHCLERRDLRVFYDEDGVRRATALLREVRPGLVFTHSPADYMLDHEETSKLARAACFNAPIPNAPVTHAGAPPLARIPHLYYADPIDGVDSFGRPIEAHLVVDIGAVMDEKLAMLACHASQREWLRRHHGMDEYIEAARRWSAERGRRAGRGFGEGFRQHRGHAYPGDDLLASALGEDLCVRLDR